MMRPVFLSASEPYPTRDREYWDSQHLANIRAAIRALCAQVLPHRPLVFGGHPAITPLVRSIAQRIHHDQQQNEPDAPAPIVLTFRSRLYGDDRAGAIMTDAHDEYGSVVPPTAGRRNMSLLRMRYEMLGRPGMSFGAPLSIPDAEGLGAARHRALETLDYAAGVFVGGMEGVEREFRIFRSFHPNTPVFPIATSGAAAARLLPEISDMPKPLHDALKEQTAYSVLFQQVLPAQVDRQIAPAWRPSDAQYSWTDHVDPAELDRASPLTDGSIP